MVNNNYLQKFTEKYDGDDVIKYSVISIAFTVLTFFLYFFEGFHYGLPDDIFYRYFTPVNITLQKIYIIYLCCYTVLCLFLIYKAFSEIVYSKFDLILSFSFIIPSVFICAHIIYLTGMTTLSNSIPVLSILFTAIYIIIAMLSILHIKRNIKLNRMPKTYSKKVTVLSYCCIFGFIFFSEALGDKILPRNPMYKQSLGAIIILFFIDYVIVYFIFKYYLKKIHHKILPF